MVIDFSLTITFSLSFFDLNYGIKIEEHMSAGQC